MTNCARGKYTKGLYNPFENKLEVKTNFGNVLVYLLFPTVLFWLFVVLGGMLIDKVAFLHCWGPLKVLLDFDNLPKDIKTTPLNPFWKENLFLTLSFYKQQTHPFFSIYPFEWYFVFETSFPLTLTLFMWEKHLFMWSVVYVLIIFFAEFPFDREDLAKSFTVLL